MATLFSDRLDSGVFAGRNAIINGNFLFWQRGTSFTADGNTSDRWRVGETTDGSLKVDRESTIKPTQDAVNYAYKVTVLTADSSLAATQYAEIHQLIEGHNYLQFIGRTATLSFWVRSSLTGTYSVAFRNGSPYDRSYIAEYTIDNANTWEYKTITLKFDYTGGTWNTTTGIGLYILFSLGCGSTYAAAPGSWLSGNYIASNNQVNWMATVGNTFYLSNVQLELGSSASPFEVLDGETQTLKVHRYYEAKYYYTQLTSTSSVQGYGYNMLTYDLKRAGPTTTYAGATFWQPGIWYDATSVTIDSSWRDRMYVVFRYTQTGFSYGTALGRATFYMDAEL